MSSIFKMKSNQHSRPRSAVVPVEVAAAETNNLFATTIRFKRRKATRNMAQYMQSKVENVLKTAERNQK